MDLSAAVTKPIAVVYSRHTSSQKSITLTTLSSC